MLAVIDHVEPDLRLPLRDLVDRARDALVQGFGAVGLAKLLGIKSIYEIRRARQAETASQISQWVNSKGLKPPN